MFLAAGLAVQALGAAAQSQVTVAGTLDVGARYVRNEGLGSISSEVNGANSTSKLIGPRSRSCGPRSWTHARAASFATGAGS